MLKKQEETKNLRGYVNNNRGEWVREGVRLGFFEREKMLKNFRVFLGDICQIFRTNKDDLPQ